MHPWGKTRHVGSGEHLRSSVLDPLHESPRRPMTLALIVIPVLQVNQLGQLRLSGLPKSHGLLLAVQGFEPMEPDFGISTHNPQAEERLKWRTFWKSGVL